MVISICDVEIAGIVHCYTFGIIKICINGRPVVSAAAPVSIACHRGDNTVCIHLADAVVTIICDVEIAGIVHCYAPGIIKPCISGRAVVSAVATGPIACHCGDNTACIHFADAVVRIICDVEIAGIVHCYALRVIKPCISGRAVVSAVAPGSIACHRGDNTACIHLADAVVKSICDVEIAGIVHC